MKGYDVCHATTVGEKYMTPEDYLKKPYTFCLVWDEEGKSWTGTVKEFPGCITQGSTTWVLAMLWWAAQDWIAAALDLGQEIPEPRGGARK